MNYPIKKQRKNTDNDVSTATEIILKQVDYPKQNNCYGCVFNILNQEAHYADPNGCLYK